jgi:hypothetical protein
VILSPAVFVIDECNLEPLKRKNGSCPFPRRPGPLLTGKAHTGTRRPPDYQVQVSSLTRHDAGEFKIKGWGGR